MSKTNNAIRTEVLDWMTRTYLGPYTLNQHGEPDQEETIHFSPKDLYTTGILYPQIRELEDIFTSEVNVDLESITDKEGDVENQERSPGNQVTVVKSRGIGEKIIDDEEEELKLTTEFNPSSMAISFLAEDQQLIEVEITFGKYFSQKDQTFKRTHYTLNFKVLCTSEGVIIDNQDPANLDGWITSQTSPKVLAIISEDKLNKIKIISRNSYTQKGSNNLRVISVSLINNYSCERSEQKKTGYLIFQPEIKVTTSDGFCCFPDLSNPEKLSEEEKEIKFLYRGYRNYGQGHGCAVDWKLADDKVKEIWTSVLPKEEINGVDFNPKELNELDDVLYMKNLSEATSDKEKNTLFLKLREFIKTYRNWINLQEEIVKIEKLDPQFENTSETLLKKCHDLYQRMEKGIDLLEEDNIILKSFLDANKAMFYQRVMADFSRHRRINDRILKNDNSSDDALPDFDLIPADAPSQSIWKDGKYFPIGAEVEGRKLAKWRPFQLAFILSQIEGISRSESIDRKTVDLLWFSTGGGKTEAYLGLIAFTIFHQRQTSSYAESGVTVMMRYTLRMLNKQQFSRANILVCACEIIRSTDTVSYGETRISNGLWVGGTTTPNKHKGSKKYPGNNDYLANYISGIESGRYNESNYSPPVFSCPCCGNKLVKEIYLGENGEISIIGRWGYHQIINRMRRRPFPDNNPFYLHCTNSKCHFYLEEEEFNKSINDSSDFFEKTLPIYYVDEDIYANRPTLLFSTVDKYAQLAWKNECFKLFNFNDNFIRIADPPCLIIQDELHLISSSLGTIYSLFEFAIDLLCTENGIEPKVVGATATVRNAKQQCIKIYNREFYSQFPPSGINIDDSFYSRKKKIDPGARLYVGVMPSGFTSTTAKLRLDSLLLEGTDQIAGASNKEADNYYTILAYFNTVKELGKYRTLLEDDMVSYRRFLGAKLHNYFKRYDPDRIIELSSQMNADQINTGLEILEKIRLHPINERDPLVYFLNSIGIRTLKDIEDTKFKNGWSYSWLRVINDHWEILKPLCSLSDEMKVASRNSEEDKVKADSLTARCCELFYSKMKEAVSSKIEDPIKVAMSTNMISVGVDIPRLNVMSISGQPKTTAEYIQASSRVGREVPGIVFTLYNPAKNRDRSHYENFKDYHQAYYKYVEATSVTPFSLPALEKTIDSVIIALMRAWYFKGSDDATLYTEGERQVRRIGKLLFKRFCEIENNLENNDSEMIERRKEAIENIVDGTILRWKSRDNLIFPTFWTIMNNPLGQGTLDSVLFTEPKYREHHLTQELLFAMSSLRDVDTSSKIKLKSYIE